MKRTSWRAVALACAATLTAAGCADKSPWGLGTNVPAAVATAEGIGFSVLAENYTADLNYIGPTGGDSVSVGLAVAGVRQGNVVIDVTDSLGTLLWQQLVTADTAVGQTYLHGRPPYHLRMEFLGFTGVLSIGVGVKAP